MCASRLVLVLCIAGMLLPQPGASVSLKQELNRLKHEGGAGDDKIVAVTVHEDFLYIGVETTQGGVFDIVHPGQGAEQLRRDSLELVRSVVLGSGVGAVFIVDLDVSPDGKFVYDFPAASRYAVGHSWDDLNVPHAAITYNKLFCGGWSTSTGERAWLRTIQSLSPNNAYAKAVIATDDHVFWFASTRDDGEGTLPSNPSSSSGAVWRVDRLRGPAVEEVGQILGTYNTYDSLGDTVYYIPGSDSAEGLAALESTDAGADRALPSYLLVAMRYDAEAGLAIIRASDLQVLAFWAYGSSPFCPYDANAIVGSSKFEGAGLVFDEDSGRIVLYARSQACSDGSAEAMGMLIGLELEVVQRPTTSIAKGEPFPVVREVWTRPLPLKAPKGAANGVIANYVGMVYHKRLGAAVLALNTNSENTEDEDNKKRGPATAPDDLDLMLILIDPVSGKLSPLAEGSAIALYGGDADDTCVDLFWDRNELFLACYTPGSFEGSAAPDAADGTVANAVLVVVPLLANLEWWVIVLISVAGVGVLGAAAFVGVSAYRRKRGLAPLSLKRRSGPSVGSLSGSSGTAGTLGSGKGSMGRSKSGSQPPPRRPSGAAAPLPVAPGMSRRGGTPTRSGSLSRAGGGSGSVSRANVGRGSVSRAGGGKGSVSRADGGKGSVSRSPPPVGAHRQRSRSAGGPRSPRARPNLGAPMPVNVPLIGQGQGGAVAGAPAGAGGTFSSIPISQLARTQGGGSKDEEDDMVSNATHVTLRSDMAPNF